MVPGDTDGRGSGDAAGTPVLSDMMFVLLK